MLKFVTHDAISQGIFNRDFCTATSTMTAWQEQLTNSEEILQLLCQRLDKDFQGTPKKLRRPWNFQQIVPCQVS